jgi:hypothetical protein
MKVYIASSEEHVGNIQEDVCIRDMCIAMGVSSEILTLRNIVKISNPSDVVILKSIWDYHLDYREFLAQVSELKKRRVQLINNYDYIIWNIDKYKYLDDIKHINAIPTHLLQINRIRNIPEIEKKISKIAKTFNANRLVIKPTVSASGYLTSIYGVNQNNDDLLVLLKANKHLDFIVQPYRSSITKGEISVIIINGELLYGVMRFPGVLSEKKIPTYLDLINVPNSIKNTLTVLKKLFMKKFGGLPVVCRVDFLKNNSTYEILEVELIDPDLFFRYIPQNVKETAVSSLLSKIYNN